MNQFGDVYLRLGQISHRREADPQADLAGDALAATGVIELALQPRDEESRAGCIGVGRQNREPGFADQPDHVRLSALLAEDVCDICKTRWTLFPQHAGADFAVLHLRRKGDAGECLVIALSARAHLSGELPQSERRVESGIRVDEVLRSRENELAAGAQECLEFGEYRIEVDGMGAVLPRARAVGNQARSRITRRRGSNDDWDRVVELRAIAN